MSKEMQAECILEAYKLLESSTPLRFDCGILCEESCCKGDENTGMWLLPGEAELIGNQEGFHVQTCQDNNGYPLLVCEGNCNRKYRPFACRIFPLFPYVAETETGGLEVFAVCDPRAVLYCPLTQYSMLHRKAPFDRPELGAIGEFLAPIYRKGLSWRFMSKVRRAGIALLGDEELKQYLLDTSKFLQETAELWKKLGQN